MKAGDRVICIDDSAGIADGVKTLVRNNIYDVVDVSSWHIDNIFVNDGTNLSWKSNRFRKLETYKATVNKVNFNTVEEGLEQPEKIKV